MVGVKDQLLAQLARFDEDALVALANRGLYRRALKDLEKQAGVITKDSAQCLVVAVAGHQVEFDARGPAHARCSCPAKGPCQHILAAAMSLQKLGVAASTKAAESELSTDPLAPLREALLAVSATSLMQHAGKAGYRWAWQFVADLTSESPLKISGLTHLVLSFHRPRISFRFMGGGIDGLLAETAIAQIEKYQVAAVLAYQLAHGHALTPPEPAGQARNEALDLGKDHVLANAPAADRLDSRKRLRTGVVQLIGECLELGLAHLSREMHERFATLAVWAQGAEYPRLAMMLRRMADHVELLLQRAGDADEHLLLDELTLAYGLVAALDAAAAQGKAPSHLIGRSRTHYDSINTLELLGLGANAWRSASGYVGLTMLFWSPSEQAFLSCTDARPEGQAGFDPKARYQAAGPWSGLSAPASATGQRLVLTQPQMNAMRRLSTSGGTSAMVMPSTSHADFTASLQPQSSWAALALSREHRQRSLLAEPQPMKDWVVLKPERFGTARFDAARQTLVWPLYDAEDRSLHAELAFSEFNAHAIGRIEQLKPTDLAPGTMLVVRLQNGLHGLRAEPLSLVRCGETGGSLAIIDALHFDQAPETGLASNQVEAPGQRPESGIQGMPGDPDTLAPGKVADASPGVLCDLRRTLRHRAERGLPAEQAQRWLAELATWAERASLTGYTSLASALSGEPEAIIATLRINYLCLQFERLIAGADTAQG